MTEESNGYFRSRFTYDDRREAVWQHLVAYLSRYIPPESAVLELGPGYCSFINHVRAAKRVAIDLSPEALQHAATGVAVHSGDAVHTLAKWPADSFDVVFASNFLEHLDWPALDAIAPMILRVLRPGGKLILMQPNFRLSPGRYFDDFTHRSVFTDQSLPDWLTSVGFQISVVEARFMPLTVKSRMARLAFLVPLYLRLPWRPLSGQMLVVASKPRPVPQASGTAAR
jgi:SAM-dependent methyltransferase